MDTGTLEIDCRRLQKVHKYFELPIGGILMYDTLN